MAEAEPGRWTLQEVTAEALERSERAGARDGRRGKDGDSRPREPVGEPLDRVDAASQAGDAPATRDHERGEHAGDAQLHERCRPVGSANTPSTGMPSPESAC